MRKKSNISFWISTGFLFILFGAGCFIYQKGWNTLRTPEKVSILKLTENKKNSFSEKLLIRGQDKYVQELIKDQLIRKEKKGNGIIYIRNNKFSDNEKFLIGMVILFSLTILIRVFRDMEKLFDLKKIREIFENEENSFGNINEEISIIQESHKKVPHFFNTSNLVSRWNEYRETLYIKKNKEKDGIEKDNYEKRYQTIDAEELFNFDVLYKEQIRSRLFLYIPQALVGIGMLGTFYGLTKGLSHLNLSDIQGIQGSVGELLSGVKTAFYTSLFGLSFSLILTFFYHIYFGEIEKSIFNIKNLINEKFPKRVKEKVYDEIMEKLTSISETNKETSGLLGNQIEKIGISMNETLGKFSNNIGSDFKETLISAFDNVFSENFINGMQNSLNQTLEVFKTNSDKMLEFKDQMNIAIVELKELKDSYVDVIKESKETKLEFKDMLNQSNETTKELLENINVNYKENNEKIEDQYKSIHLNLVTACEKIKNISEDYSVFEETNKKIVTQYNGLHLNLETVCEKIKNISEDYSVFEETNKKVSNEIISIQDNNLKIFQKTSDKMLEFKDQMNIAIVELKELKDSYVDVIKESKETKLEFKDMLNQSNETTKELLENINVNYKENNEKIVNNYKSIGSSLEITCEKIKNISEDYSVFEEINKNVAKEMSDIQNNNIEILNKNGIFLEDIKGVLEEIKDNKKADIELKNLWKSYCESFKEINDNLNKNSNLYRENLEETSLEFRNIIKNISQQYQTVIKDQTVDYTTEIRRGLSELFKDYDSNLAVVVDKFNGVLQVFQDKMQYFSENLSENKNIIDKTSETFQNYDSNLSTIVDNFNITLNNFENKMQKFTNSLLETKEMLIEKLQEEKKLLSEKEEEIKKSN